MPHSKWHPMPKRKGATFVPWCRSGHRRRVGPRPTSRRSDRAGGVPALRRPGFEGTTIDAIAAEVGVGRRTLFRYFPSKNDIPWGQFDRTLDGFREILAPRPSDLPLAEAVGQAPAFNDFADRRPPPHRDRMRLILGDPGTAGALGAALRHWRAVIAEYAAGRLGLEPHDLEPQLVGQVSLSLSMVAYDAWLRDPGADLTVLIERAVRALQDHL